MEMGGDLLNQCVYIHISVSTGNCTYFHISNILTKITDVLVYQLLYPTLFLSIKFCLTRAYEGDDKSYFGIWVSKQLWNIS